MEMINTQIRIGEYEVLSSGVIPIWGKDSILLTLDPNIRVRILFASSKEEANMVHSEIVDGVLEYTLTNFNNPLGTEFTQPAVIGTFMGRKLLFHIKILGNSNADNKTLFYTWLLGGTVTDGK